MKGNPHPAGRLLPLLLLIAACEETSIGQAAEDLFRSVSVCEQGEGVEKRVQDLQDQVDLLHSALSYLVNLKREPTARQVGVFDMASDAYQVIGTPLAPFAVSVKDVESYVDGARVTLAVGNPTTATVSRATLVAKWGPRFPASGIDETIRWSQSLQEQTIKVPTDLLPGTWNLVTLTLPKTKPEQLGHLEISIDIGTISLVTPPQKSGS